MLFKLLSSCHFLTTATYLDLNLQITTKSNVLVQSTIKLIDYAICLLDKKDAIYNEAYEII